MLWCKKCFVSAYQIWFVWSCLASLVQGATILSAADLQLIGYRSDAPDSVAWVNWVPIQSGTQIHFTDNGWRADNTFRSGEDVLTWTSNSVLPVGSVVVISSADLDGLSASGDQILAYQGLASNPQFVYGLDFSGSENPPIWDSDATNTKTSTLPSGLAGFGSLAVRHFDNGQYSGPRSGLSTIEFKTAITDAANWNFSNSTSFASLSTEVFVLASSVPEPAAWLLWIAVAGSFLLVRLVMQGRRF